MGSERVRIGFVGAGNISRIQHLPGIKKAEGAELVVVSNRSKESGQAIAKDFDVPEVETDWRSLVARDDLDAIFIGTWPYMHKEMAVAVLEAGKHCFTQARMAMNLDEAKAMLASAEAHPHLVSMICPAPSPCRPFLERVMAEGRLGDITSVELSIISGDNLDAKKIHWREQIEYSGRQAMWLGVFTETLHRVVGPYEMLSAQKSIPIPAKKLVSGQSIEIDIPQVITVTGKLENGGLGLEHHSALAVDASSRCDQIIIRGLDGTIRHDFGETVEMAGPGEELRQKNVPENLKFSWTVEQEFIDAVRCAKRGEWPTAKELLRKGAGKPVNIDFLEGLAYMRKIEAVHLSAETSKGIRPADL